MTSRKFPSQLLSGLAMIALTLGTHQTALAAGHDPAADLEERDMLVSADDAMADTPSEAGVTTSARDYWGDWGVDTSVIDPSVKPGDDFNAYVNGQWLKTFEIPADRSRYGAFTLLAEKSEQRVKLIIEELAAAKPDPATLEGKIAAYYNAYMDVDAINAAGLAPARPLLDRIYAVKTQDDLARAFGTTGLASPFGGGVGIDAKRPDRYVVYMSQSGLGMPDRDYYLVDSEANLKIRAAYIDYLTFLMGKLNYADPAGAAASVYDLEKQIAALHWDRALGRNRDLTYNLVNRDELVKMAGDFPILAALDEMGIADQQEFVIRQVAPTAEEIAAAKLTPEQAEKLSGGVFPLMQLTSRTPIATWQAYMAAQLLSGFSSVLPSDIDAANFAFYGKTLSGQQEQRERWKRAVSAVEGSLGEGVGKVYAARYFPPEAKSAMDELVTNLRKAMSANLDDISWIGDATKVEARDKLAKFTPKIGYPTKFETYDSLSVSPNTAFANALAASQWGEKDNLSKLGKPIDRTEWGMLPQTVNAYYNSTLNEIVFPAAILQPPFFNLTADPAVNYGAIGGVIGHEIGHGFDDQGSKSDGTGALRDWWTPADKANFEKLTGALVAQYDAYCPLDDGKTCINGRLTLGENIGDLGGLSMAYRAYKLSLGGKEAPVIDGLTGDQRFFMAWAQVWRNKSREEYLRQQLRTDSHSPADYRINGIVRNFDEWYKAFNIQPGDKLYLPPEKRLRIW